MTSRLALALLIVCGTASVSRAEDADGKALPKVLLLGDSIRLSYTEFVTQQLDGKAVIVSHKANGGDSTNTLSHLTEWAIKVQPDVIHFNCGIHDTKWFEKDQRFQVSPDQYADNLRTIVKRLREETSAKLFFATTTPILDERAAAAREGRDYALKNASIQQYNDIARKVMAELNVPVNDLNAALTGADLPVDKLIGDDGVHLTPAGRELAGQTVATFLQMQLVRVAD
ncbi:MAG: SGNH/GDSL hydrolase family protein [Planctomycetaceae bacterium]